VGAGDVSALVAKHKTDGVPCFGNLEGDAEVTIVQVHPDVDSMEFHMKVIREHVEHAAWEFLGDTVSEHIYGAVSDSALETMRLQGSPGPEVKSHGIGGFTRSAAEATAVRS
jgi:hypothetical protein